MFNLVCVEISMQGSWCFKNFRLFSFVINFQLRSISLVLIRLFGDCPVFVLLF